MELCLYTYMYNDEFILIRMSSRLITEEMQHTLICEFLAYVENGVHVSHGQIIGGHN